MCFILEYFTNKAIQMKLSEKIKILRKNNGLSQKELADKVGIHITHLSRLENKHLQPSLDVL